jgi:hypothetical protein
MIHIDSRPIVCSDPGGLEVLPAAETENTTTTVTEHRHTAASLRQNRTTSTPYPDLHCCCLASPRLRAVCVLQQLLPAAVVKAPLASLGVAVATRTVASAGGQPLCRYSARPSAACRDVFRFNLPIFVPSLSWQIRGLWYKMTQKRHVFPHRSFEPPPPSASMSMSQSSEHAPTCGTRVNTKLLPDGENCKKTQLCVECFYIRPEPVLAI